MKRVSPVTPQSKMVDIANQFGQKNVKNQQGSTRIIYDTLELKVGQDIYNFFQNVNTRQFPMTNMQNGNKLEVGEMLTMQYAWLSIMTEKLTEGAIVEYQLQDLAGGSLNHSLFNGTDTTAIGGWTFTENYLKASTKIALGELSFMVGNTQTLKPISLQAFHPSYNKSSKNNSNTVFHFDTLLTVPPMLEFIAPVKILPLIAADLPSAASGKIYLRLHLEGAGSIISPRQNF